MLSHTSDVVQARCHEDCTAAAEEWGLTECTLATQSWTTARTPGPLAFAHACQQGTPAASGRGGALVGGGPRAPPPCSTCPKGVRVAPRAKARPGLRAREGERAPCRTASLRLATCVLLWKAEFHTACRLFRRVLKGRQSDVPGGGGGGGAVEGQGPWRRPQRRLDGRLEEVAKAVGGGYCRLQMPLKLALGVQGDSGWA